VLWRQGAVYTNRMINVGVLNNKLYFRAIDMVQMFSGASRSDGVCHVTARRA
jgi:N-acetylmuramic acid 6-phosphate (MurNAc-6-P) etherase